MDSLLSRESPVTFSYIPCQSREVDCLSEVDQKTIFDVSAGVGGPITVTKVEVEGCNGPPCIAKRGSNSSITISFKTSKYEKL